MTLDMVWRWREGRPRGGGGGWSGHDKARAVAELAQLTWRRRRAVARWRAGCAARAPAARARRAGAGRGRRPAAAPPAAARRRRSGGAALRAPRRPAAAIKLADAGTPDPLRQRVRGSIAEVQPVTTPSGLKYIDIIEAAATAGAGDQVSIDTVGSIDKGMGAPFSRTARPWQYHIRVGTGELLLIPGPGRGVMGMVCVCARVRPPAPARGPLMVHR